MACGKYHKATKSGFGNFMKKVGKGIWTGVKGAGELAAKVAPYALQAAQLYTQFKK